MEARRLFYRAGLLFEKSELFKYAASCFFTACSYTKACEIFTKLELWAQAGECMAHGGTHKLK